MSIFLILLLVAAMIAVVVVFVRGLVVFLANATEEAKNGGTGPSASALKSNKMMQYRIFFQAIAIVIVVLLLMLAGKG
ncbi:twin transmembrane helix small protein [Sphingomonas aliaeris]|jgi:heme/copper-type cytochrome/quinol oxidase subunit 2|uniref:Twin transmembrane helix small protein n=1 Tax=Sphingomonas aliaeris TaxID=2759526 RepID=A0A974NUN2_9SPHN|nr:twin transmembrane helix small protein [Sphingomonas aliaeris]QQV77264.1 twin transmembrane helix small protein [Sphingomonas aliaeris]